MWGAGVDGGQDKTSKGKRLSSTCGETSRTEGQEVSFRDRPKWGFGFELGPRSQLSCHFFREAFPDLA